MSFLLAFLVQAASPFEVSDEQFQPYVSCIYASVRLIPKEAPAADIYLKAEGNCQGEQTSMLLDLQGKALEQPGATSSSKPDYRDLERRNGELRAAVMTCLANYHSGKTGQC